MEKVNINRADEKELQKIIHIGPFRANKMIELGFSGYKFKDIYELSTILGLGPKRMNDIIKQGIVEV